MTDQQPQNPQQPRQSLNALPRPALLQPQPQPQPQHQPQPVQPVPPASDPPLPQAQLQQPYSRLQVFVPPLMQPQQEQAGQSTSFPSTPLQSLNPSGTAQPPSQPSGTAQPPFQQNPPAQAQAQSEVPKKRIGLIVGIVVAAVALLAAAAALILVFVLPTGDSAPASKTPPVVSQGEPPESITSEPPASSPSEPAPADPTQYVSGVVGPSLADRSTMDSDEWLALEQAALEEASLRSGAAVESAFFEGAFVNDYHYDVFLFRSDGTFTWYKDMTAYAYEDSNYYEGTYTLYPVARASDGLTWRDGEYITRTSAGETAQTLFLHADTYVDADGYADWNYDWTFFLTSYIANGDIGDGFFALNSSGSGETQGYVRFDDGALAIRRLMANPDGSQNTIALPWP